MSYNTNEHTSTQPVPIVREAYEHKIKFAVLGVGHIGKRHAEVITRNAESELVAIIATFLSRLSVSSGLIFRAFFFRKGTIKSL